MKGSTLPPSFRTAWRSTSADSRRIGELFSLNDFVQRVGEIEGTSFEEALAHTGAVMGVLGEAVTEGEMEDVRRQFPSEFAPLFEPESRA